MPVLDIGTGCNLTPKFSRIEYSESMFVSKGAIKCNSKPFLISALIKSSLKFKKDWGTLAIRTNFFNQFDKIIHIYILINTKLAKIKKIIIIKKKNLSHSLIYYLIYNNFFIITIIIGVIQRITI